MINGSFWLGAVAGAASPSYILAPRIFAANFGWRLGFGVGAVIGLVILYLRRFIPESPRWLFTHGRRDEAEKIVGEFEEEIGFAGSSVAEFSPEPLRIVVRHSFGLEVILRPLLSEYRTRSILG